MKDRPGYPKKPFALADEAQAWVDGIVAWCNGTSLCSGIRFVTPNARHRGRDVEVVSSREARTTRLAVR